MVISATGKKARDSMDSMDSNIERY